MNKNTINLIKSFGIAGIALCGVAMPVQAQKTVKQPNILFIAVDDLKPILGCYR